METTETEKLFICSACSTEHKEHDTHTGLLGERLCTECFDDKYTSCDICESITNTDEVIYAGRHDDTALCPNCYRNNYFICDVCEHVLHNDVYSQDSTCENCFESDDESENENEAYNRKYDTSNAYVTHNKRAYSTEIECYYKNYSDFVKVGETLPKCIGISNDGSLNQNGKEFQTPKLSGIKGDKILKTLSKTLLAYSFYVDRTCGLHIHLDTSDIAGNADKIKTVILFYLAFESVIFSYLPISRRKNRYCLPLSEFYHESEIAKCYYIQDIEKIWYREQESSVIVDRKKNKYDSSRYAGINLHSLLSNGHIEIRSHSGTLDYRKIKMWIELHSAILDAVAHDKITTSHLPEVKYIIDPTQKQDKMFSLLTLSDSVKNYFIDRQKKFCITNSNNENICVE